MRKPVFITGEEAAAMIEMCIRDRPGNAALLHSKADAVHSLQSFEILTQILYFQYIAHLKRLLS